MGLFHFPLNELAGWALNNMGMVILCFMLPTFIAALAFLPFLRPVPQTITIFSITIGTFFSLLSSCLLVVLFLPASFLIGKSDLRPSLNDTQKNLKICSCSTTVLSNPEPS